MNNTLLLISLGIIIILILICFILNMINASKINTLMDYGEDGNIVKALKFYYKKVDNLANTVNMNTDTATQSRLANCENEAALSIQKLGIVHFDAFDDVHGNLSFALAMLNNNDDGIILTSLYGHNSCNTYVREVNSGKTAIKILDEEVQALDKAKNKIKKVNQNGNK